MLLLLLACTGDTTLNKGEAHFEWAPDAVDFGEVVVGGELDLPITVRNTGYGQLTFEGIDFADLSSPSLTLVEYPIDGLGHDEEGAIILRFSPTAEGQALGILELATTDLEAQAVEIAVQGIGVLPQVDVDPETLDFGQVEPGGAYTLPIQINAAGSGALSIDGFTFPGAESVAYTVTPPSSWTTPYELAAGTGVRVDVTFSPPTDDPYDGELWVLTNDPDEPYAVVRLKGNSLDDGPNEAPVVEILDPNNGAFFLDDEVVTLRGQAVDDGAVTALVCAWYAGEFAVAAALPDTSGAIVSEATLPAGDIELTLRCVDAEGGIGQDTASLTVWPAEGPFEYVLTGGTSIFDYITVDDDLIVEVNGEVVYADNDGGSSELPPFSFEASVGDTIHVVLIDENYCDAYLDPLWIHFGASVHQSLNVEQFCISACDDHPCYDAAYVGPWPGNVAFEAEFVVTIP